MILIGVKTSKLGGLPNYTYEPCKLVLLGKMFKIGAEYLSGIIVYQNVVQMAEVQSRKKYFNDKSSLPGDVLIIAIAYAWSHTSTSFFVSTCGSTHPASISNETHFEDELGVIKSKMIA